VSGIRTLKPTEPKNFYLKTYVFPSVEKNVRGCRRLRRLLRLDV